MVIFAMLLLCVSTAQALEISLSTVVQDSGITFNGFACPANAVGDATCKDERSKLERLKLHENQTVMIFSPQLYWLKLIYTEHEKIEKKENRQSLATTFNNVKNSFKKNKSSISSSAQDAADTTIATKVQQALEQKGMSTGGGYCLLISTDNILTSLIEPSVTPKDGQMKVVTQLWYNGSSLIQLWSQSATVVQSGGDFVISISLEEQAETGGLVGQANGADIKIFGSDDWKKTIYTAVEIAPARYADQASAYQQAATSPRSVLM